MTGPVPAGYAELRTSAAALLLARDVLSVTGPDAAAYLQGQCSQDVAALSAGTGAEALLLTPQGKVDAYLRVSVLDADRFVLDTDAGAGLVVAARLERFRLRVDVVIEPLDWWCVAVRGPEAEATVDAVAVPGGPGSGDETPALRLPVAWPGLSGVDLLGPAPPGGEEPSSLPWLGEGTVRCDAAAWEAARIEASVPVNGRELDGRTIAAEVGLVERTVSFTKGCFTGQELVARLDARGSKVARHLCGVVLDPAVAPEQADGLVGGSVHPAGAVSDDAPAGHLTSAAWSPGLGRVVALALLHRRVAPPAAVVVDAAGVSVGGEARSLPLVGGGPGR